jgi:kynurenine formamidase
MENSHGAPLMAAIFFTFFCATALCGQAGEPNVMARFFKGIQSGSVKVVDLTHTVDKESPYWPEDTPGTPFHASIAATYRKDGYFARNLSMPEHFGTHLDAPVHFDPRGETVDRIAVEKFLAPAVVIDVRSAARSNADYRVTAQDVENWIKSHGAIPAGAVVFFRTGWGARWPSQKRYMNADAKGVLHFPGLSLGAARYLLKHSKPVGIGIDTGSIDYGPSKDFPVHHLTLSAGLYHLENVANLGQVPATGFSVIALPLKLGGGSGAPARVLAFVPIPSHVSH